MGRKRGISLACAVALLAALSFAAPARATTPAAVSGTWDWDGLTWVTEKVVGGNEFFSGTEATARTGWSGSFEGESFDTYTGVIHRGGTLIAQLTINFDGTVLGRSGTMVMEINCLANRGHGFEGAWRITRGTGDLEGLHGTGTWGAWGGELVEYKGAVHWE